MSCFRQRVCMCTWGLNSENLWRVVTSNSHFCSSAWISSQRWLPGLKKKSSPPVVRPFVYKYLGRKEFQKLPWKTGFIPWWHPRAHEVSLELVVPLASFGQFFNSLLWNTPKNRLKINVCLVFQGSIFQVTKAKVRATNSWRTGLTGDCWNLVSPISIIPLFLSLFPKRERRSPSWRCTTNFPDLGLTSRYAIQGALFLDTANDTWVHLCVPGFKKDEDNVFFDCMIVFQENQLEPMDGRKGLTSGWNLFDFSIFFRWYPNSNHYIFGLGFFSGKIPPIGTTGWKEGVN